MIINPVGTFAITQATIAAGNTIVRGSAAQPTQGVLVTVAITSAATAGAAVTINDSNTGTGGTILATIPIGATGVVLVLMPYISGLSIPQQAALTTGNFTLSFS